MPLKFVMDSMEGVDASIASLYTKQSNGSFVLSGIDGIVPKSKLDEFRNNNIELNNRLAAFGDITPDAIKTLQTELGEAKIRLKGTENFDQKVDEIVESRISAFRETATTEKANLESKVSTLSSLLEEVVLENYVSKDAIRLGVAETAVEDVVMRARTVFKVDGKNPIAKDKDGKVIYGKDGSSPLPVSEWIDGLKKTHPHLFKQSQTTNMHTSHGTYVGDVSKLSPLQKIQQGLG